MDAADHYERQCSRRVIAIDMLSRGRSHSKRDHDQACIISNSRKLKFCSLNSSNYSAIDFHYTFQPLAVNLKKLAEHHRKRT